jgi:threonine/homoserine/homoserine lactone efflux protein
MLRTLVVFIPIAALLSVTPGPATAMVVRSAARGGRRDALLTTAGNSVGILVWACLAAGGVAAAVAASATVFAAVKLAGALFLVALGLGTLRGATGGQATRCTRGAGGEAPCFTQGLLGGIANPKLGAFFVALFPQFVPAGEPALAAALLMACTIVLVDLVWFSTVAYLVTRAKRAFVDGPWLRRVERLTGAVLVGLGVRLALERR